MDDTIEKLANEYLRQERLNTEREEAMRRRHQEEMATLLASIYDGPDNPWTFAFRELRIERTPDLVEQVAKRLREMQK